MRVGLGHSEEVLDPSEDQCIENWITTVVPRGALGSLESIVITFASSPKSRATARNIVKSHLVTPRTSYLARQQCKRNKPKAPAHFSVPQLGSEREQKTHRESAANPDTEEFTSSRRILTSAQVGTHNLKMMRTLGYFRARQRNEPGPSGATVSIDSRGKINEAMECAHERRQRLPQRMERHNPIPMLCDQGVKATLATAEPGWDGGRAVYRGRETVACRIVHSEISSIEVQGYDNWESEAWRQCSRLGTEERRTY
ncbi:hypothetical protein B0H16DRAFT_1463241 [Mycena metata]|uniref:Uncharacterized protein n=1 Tax=Mycena metata TaxID=1033252 RepID=A0AAD7N3Q9_9AGAR|nr:hypothetical protein B0H16DRAFT_1463241 [Mycena metata]